MTRCKEFYDKWEQQPNWCNKCQSAVSQIDNYLGLARELEKEGVNRNITFAILPETVAREVLTAKDRNKERTVKNLAEYLKSPNCTKIRVSQAHGFIQRTDPRLFTPPSYETVLRHNEKKIEQYRTNIRILEQENERLRACIIRDNPVADSSDGVVLVDEFIEVIDKMLLQIHQAYDVSDEDSNGKVKAVGTMSVVGMDSVKAKLIADGAL
jgi:hypothetical protein